MICNSSAEQNNCMINQFNESDQTDNFVNIDEIDQTANFDANFDQTDKINKIDESDQIKSFNQSNVLY